MRAPFVITLLIGAVAALVVIWPQAIGAHRLPVMASVVSFRALLSLTTAVLALALAVFAVTRRRWGVAAALAISLTAMSAGNGLVLAVRGDGPARAVAGDLKVMAWNTYGGSVSPQTIARVIEETGSEVVSLPETDAFAAAQVVGILEHDGVEMQHDTVWAADGGEPIPTTILISTDLGAYARDRLAGSTPGLPSGIWRPVRGAGPIVVAAHPMPPFPDLIAQWDDGLSWIADRCRDGEVIVAGDLNATLDHFAGHGVDGGDLGRCRDAAGAVGAAAAGTWPAGVPAAMGAPIDHILAGPAWTVDRFAVLRGEDGAGSDHRPIVATLSRR
ncbi:putative conserved protein YafD, endonuclease/exonuclease/phosphatase (EEP) superfamily [Microbacterium hydrothermale]|nr:putative conserved protein YafD, endonuclease/exonuclease/phosphatase (EEP) superfamily [Microbacterium hydrothermale]